MQRERLLVGILVAAGCGVAAVACGNGGTPATTSAPSHAGTVYTVVMDALSTNGRNVAYTQYFPASLRVHAGDSVDFVNLGSVVPHTVTFGVAADRSDQPAFDLNPNGFSAPNVAVEGACVTEQPSDPAWTECPPGGATSVDNLPAYGGKGFWNSGLIFAGYDLAVAIAPSTPPGEYRFVCLVHPAMSGTLDVVPAGSKADAPPSVERQGKVEQRHAQAAKVPAIPVPTPAGSGTTTVAAGWVGGTVLINEFAPSDVTIHAGESVTWRFAYVHSVTFEGTKLDDRGAEFPSGAPSGSALGAAGANSGYIYGTSTDPTFSLRFDTPGTYRYSCLLHTGMTGVVHVKAAKRG
jgi:plastocyanin